MSPSDDHGPDPDSDSEDHDSEDEFDEDEDEAERDKAWYARFARAQLFHRSHWFIPLDDDEFANELPEDGRLLLGAVIGELRDALLAEGEALRRLYPTAYPDDEEKDAEYGALAHDQLLMARLEGLDIVERTLEADTLTVSELNAWLQAVNQARLVLGTQLDIGESDPREYDPDDPDAPRLRIYRLLGRVLNDLVDALHGALPPPTGAEPPVDPGVSET